MSSPGTRPALPPCLLILSSAEAMTLGRGDPMPPEAAAYEEARRIAVSSVDALQWMLRGATPAGRMYAALLLATVDPARGRAAWASLRGVHSRVVVSPGEAAFFSGTVSEFAESMLDEGPPSEEYGPLARIARFFGFAGGTKDKPRAGVDERPSRIENRR